MAIARTLLANDASSQERVSAAASPGRLRDHPVGDGFDEGACSGGLVHLEAHVCVRVHQGVCVSLCFRRFESDVIMEAHKKVDDAALGRVVDMQGCDAA